MASRFPPSQSESSSSASEESDSETNPPPHKHPKAELLDVGKGKLGKSVDKAYKAVLEAKHETQEKEVKVAWGRNREGIKMGTFLRRGSKKEVTWRTPQSTSSTNANQNFVSVTIIGSGMETPRIDTIPAIMIPQVFPLPKMDTWTPINHNILGKDDDALLNMPWLGDDKLDNDPEFFENLIKVYDGKIHDELGSKVKKELDDQMLVELVHKVGGTGVGWVGKGKGKGKGRSNKQRPSEIPDFLVFEAISKYFEGTQGTSQEIKLKYLKLTKRSDSSSEDKPKEGKILDYACQRCGLMMFCDVHPNKPNPDGKLGDSFQRLPEDEADEKMDEAKKPCGVTCYLHLNGQEVQKPDESHWTETEIADLKEALTFFPKEEDFDPCLFKILIQPSTKTCAQVYSFALILRSQPEFQTEQQIVSLSIVPGSSKNANPKRKSSVWAKHADKDKSVCIKSAYVDPYEPCNHPGKSCDDSNNCGCMKTKNFCQKYCYCGDKCTNRFPGCNCSTGKCNTHMCPCFFNSRECDTSLCGPCGATSNDPSSIRCKNQGLQRKQYKRLLVGPSDLDGGIGIVGYGVFLKEPVLKDELIGEYCGELISPEEADRRGRIYDAKHRHFMFELNKKFVIDAYRFGNELRFANHSSTNANARCKVMMVCGDHRIGIYALDDISVGQELLFDYELGNSKKYLNFDEI